MISLENFNMMDFIPQSLKESKDVQILCDVFDLYLQEEIYAKRDRLFLFNFEKQTDDNVIDELAYQEHVDYYDPSLSKEQKAELVKNSFKTHLTKGTKHAVESALYTVFSDFTLSEWFEYGGQPYHFKVVQNITAKDTDELLSAEETQKILNFINEYKNVRSICEGFIKLVEYTIPFKTTLTSKADITAKARYSFYRLLLDGTWELNNENQKLDGELYGDFRSVIRDFSYQKIESRFGKLLLNGEYQLDGQEYLDSNTYTDINPKVIKYEYRKIESRLVQPYLFLTDKWKLDNTQTLNGINSCYPYEINKVKVIKDWNIPELSLNGSWELNGNQNLNEQDIRYPRMEI